MSLEIGDILGIADRDKLPDWAKEKLAEHEKNRDSAKMKHEPER